jgi:hypothetical protein
MWSPAGCHVCTLAVSELKYQGLGPETVNAITFVDTNVYRKKCQNLRSNALELSKIRKYTGSTNGRLLEMIQINLIFSTFNGKGVSSSTAWWVSHVEQGR